MAVLRMTLNTEEWPASRKRTKINEKVESRPYPVLEKIADARQCEAENSTLKSMNIHR
jgi:hypothetical protein